MIGHVVCSDCSKHRRPLPKFGYDNAVRCCNTCDLHITMQEMNSGMLGSQSLKQLKQYIRCYNLPSQHALEKGDLVKLIFNTRPLTNQNERHYRKLRDQQYASQVEAHTMNQGQQQQNDNIAGELSDDNPLSNMFNKFSELFIPPDPVAPTQQQQSSTSTPPRQRQHQPPQSNYRPSSHNTRSTQQQQPPSHQRPPPPTSQTSAQQHTSPSSYPSYIYPERQRQRQQQQQARPRPGARPSTTPTTSPPPHQSSPPPPSTTPSPPGNTVTLKEMLALSIDPATMSVRTLKHILRTNHVEQNFALEKKDLVARVQQLIEDEKKLQKERHPADDTNGGSSGSGDEIHEDMVCRICYDSVQNCVFLNCGHMATCIDCGLKLVETKNECPICRDSIVRVVRVFRS